MQRIAHRLMSLTLAVCLFMSICCFGELGKYDPSVVTIAATVTTLLAADTTTRTLKIVQLTNTGNYDVWFCNFAHTPVVGRGFYLPVGSTMILTGNTVPQEGLKAIANGGATTVAIGKG
jgi:hypothetical protein